METKIFNYQILDLKLYHVNQELYTELFSALNNITTIGQFVIDCYQVLYFESNHKLSWLASSELIKNASAMADKYLKKEKV